VAEQSEAHRAGERAVRNTTVRAAGEVVGKLSTFLLFAVLAREVGQEGLGSFVFAFAFLGVALIPVALGCDTYMLREVAKDRAAADRLFFNVLALKLVMAGPVLAVCFVAVAALGYDGRTRDTVYVLAVGLLLDLMGKSLNAMFNATERSDLLVRSLMLQRVITAGLGIGALAAGYGVVAVAALYSIGSAVGFVVGMTSLSRHHGLPPRIVDRSAWRGLTASSFPFAVQDVVTGLLFKLDAVILSLMAAEAAVGRYGAAYRVLEATMFLGWALNGAFVAMYTYLGRDTDPTVGAVFQRSIKAAIVLLTPVAIVMGLLAEPVMKVGFGEDFASAAAPLRLLAPVAVALSVMTLTSSLIITRRSPKTMVKLTASAVFLNATLNVALIPSLEDSGAALAMLLTEVALVVASLWLASREVGGVDWLHTLAGPLGGGAAMAAVMVALGSLPLVALVAGVAVYSAALAAVERVASPGDLDFVVGIARKRLRRGPLPTSS